MLRQPYQGVIWGANLCLGYYTARVCLIGRIWRVHAGLVFLKASRSCWALCSTDSQDPNSSPFGPGAARDGSTESVETTPADDAACASDVRQGDALSPSASQPPASAGAAPSSSPRTEAAASVAAVESPRDSRQGTEARGGTAASEVEASPTARPRVARLLIPPTSAAPEALVPSTPDRLQPIRQIQPGAASAANTPRSALPRPQSRTNIAGSAPNTPRSLSSIMRESSGEVNRIMTEVSSLSPQSHRVAVVLHTAVGMKARRM